MRFGKVIKAMAALAMAGALVACGASSMELETLEDVSGVKVTAENAGVDNVVTSEGAITVAEGDVIVISPFLDKGAFNLTITEHDTGAVVYDDAAEGKVMFPTSAEPGTYDVEVSGDGATGWMTVFAISADEVEQQNASLEEALEEAEADAEQALDSAN